MSEASRRGFLAMAGAGAAAAGVAAVSTPASAAPVKAHQGTHVEGSLVAHVRDVKTGQVSVMVEGREVVVTDHALVAHLTSKLA